MEFVNTIIESHTGNINYKELLDTLMSKNVLSEQNYLVDIRNAKLELDSSVLNDFIKRLRLKSQNPSKVKIAIVTDDSNQVVIATLFKMLQGKNSNNIKIFSVLDNAMKWLKISNSINEVENYIVEMNNLKRELSLNYFI